MIKRNNMKLTAMALIVGVSLVTGCANQKEVTTHSSLADLKVESMSTVSEGSMQIKYDEEDYYTSWNENNVTKITLGDSISIEGQGASVEDHKLTISDGGTYVISGKLSDGQIVVDSESKSTVRLVLNGAEITSLNSAPIYVKSANKVVLSLEEGTNNILTDTKDYVFEEGSDEPDATLFSKDDLVINGLGTLNINANYGDGITSKDSLKIMEGTLIIHAADDGIKGKDMVAINDGNLTIEAVGDGIKSTNSSDEEKGFIYIDKGTFAITAEGDGVQAETDLEIVDGQFNLITGGGNIDGRTHTDAFAMKGGMGGFKPDRISQGTAGQTAGGNVQAPSDEGSVKPGNEGMTPPSNAGSVKPSDAGTIRPSDEGMTPPSDAGSVTPSDVGTVSPSDEGMTAPGSESTLLQKSEANVTATTDTDLATDTDETTSAKAIKAGNSLVIKGGNFKIDSSDDGIHSNNTVAISGGSINIETGDDGVHADGELTINEGTINISKSYEGIESKTINLNGGSLYVVASDDGINASDGSSSEDAMGDPMSSSGTALLNINGGYLYVDASGDGLDSNGAIKMKGGVVIVNGPTNGGNGALDYDATFDITGGTLIAAGSSQMAQSISSTSTQNAVSLSFTDFQEVGQSVNILDETEKVVISFTPAKAFQNVLISSPSMKTKSTYTYAYGGKVEGEAKDGLIENSKYVGGTTVSDFTISDVVTYLNETGVVTEGPGMNKGGRGNGGMRGQKQVEANNSTTNSEGELYIIDQKS